MNPFNIPIDIKILKKGMKAQKEAPLRKNINSQKVIQLLLKKDYNHISLLIFYYLDYLEPFKNVPNTKSSIMLAFVFKADGSENIRKMLSDFEALKTRENLINLRELFKEFKLTAALAKVKRDLLKVQKSK